MPPQHRDLPFGVARAFVQIRRPRERLSIVWAKLGITLQQFGAAPVIADFGVGAPQRGQQIWIDLTLGQFLLQQGDDLGLLFLIPHHGELFVAARCHENRRRDDDADHQHYETGR
jgi:hypothetical protein